MRTTGLIILLLAGSLCGCSAYQSEGREFLEEQAFDFAFAGQSVAAAQLMRPCAELVRSPRSILEGLGVEIESRGDIKLYEAAEHTLLAYANIEDRHFACERAELSRDGFLNNYETNIDVFASRIQQLVSDYQ